MAKIEDVAVEITKPVYAGGLKFVEIRGNLAVFAVDSHAQEMHWGDDEGGREIELSEFTVDKKYWEMLGKPDEIALGFSTEEGWNKNWRKKEGEKDDE